MKIFKKIFIISFLVILMATGGICVSAETTEIHIVSTSDMHGSIMKNEAEKKIGYGNIYSINNSVENSIIVDSGDFLGDTFQKKTTLNENIIYAMNESGYDYALFGEAESKYTYEEFSEIIKNARFKVLCSNVTLNDEKIFHVEQIKIVGDKKIGVFGVSEAIENTNGYVYEDPVKAASDSVKKLRSKGAQIIVGLVYSKTDDLAETIAANEKDITVVAEGGTHIERPQATLIKNRTLVTNTGTEGNALNVTKLFFSGRKLQSFETTNYNLESIQATYPQTNELEEKMKNAQTDIDGVLENVVGTLESDLALSEERYYSSTELGNFLCDVIKEKTGADVVILNSKNIIGGLEKNVTQAQINNLFDKNNNVTVRKITAKSLYNVMSIVANKMVTDENGNFDEKASANEKFMQISGMKVKYNPANDSGDKIIEFYINDKKISWLDDNTEYLIASTQEVFENTNEYLAALEIEKNHGDVSDIILEYVKDGNNTIEITAEDRYETTDAQKQYWWVIWLIAAGFLLIVVVVFVIAKILMYFSR